MWLLKILLLLYVTPHRSPPLIDKQLYCTAQILVGVYLRNNHLSGEGTPIKCYSGKEFLRLMREILPVNDTDFNNKDHLHLSLASKTGKIIPMNLLDASAMVTHILEVFDYLKNDGSKKDFIQSTLHEWVKLIKAPKDTPKGSRETLESSWKASLMYDEHHVGGHYNKLGTVDQATERIIKWGYKLQNVATDSKNFGMFNGKEELKAPNVPNSYESKSNKPLTTVKINNLKVNHTCNH